MRSTNGNGEAALRLGKTYDTHFLEQAHARGVRSDVAVATRWYQRARDLGASQAESLLKRAENK
jgi:TPR repeat protein